MFVFHDHTAGQNQNMKIGDKSFESVIKIIYLGVAQNNLNCLHEEIKSEVNSGNACYYSVQNLLPYSLLLENIKIKMYRTIILPVVLHGSETWSLTMRKEHRLKVFKNRLLRKIFGPERDKVTEMEENA